MQQLTDKEFVELLARRDIQIAGKNGKLQINSPAGAVNDAIRSELSRRKPNLLSFFETAPSQDRKPGEDRIPASNYSEPAPLTFAQQRLWLIDNFHPGNLAYSIPEAFRIDGSFEVPLLQKAVNALLERHQILRAYIEEVHGTPQQRVAKAVTVPVGFSDLSSGELATLERRAHEAIYREASRSFDIHHAPLVRFHVFRLDVECHVVLVNIHHILADRWSLRVLRRELTHLYSLAAGGRAGPLPALPIQYADYARWEQQQVHTRGFQIQVDYWMQKLQGAPAKLELPFARPHPLTPSFAGAVQPCEIDKSLTGKVKQLAQSEGASLFMTVLAAFSVLLNRYTGEEDFCIGSPISGRNRMETEPLIGLFVNTLLLRCEPRSQETFRELLRRTRATALEAYENSEVPFQKLVIDLHPDRNPGVSPLFQVFFALDAQMPEEEFGAAQLDAYPSVAKFDLTLQLTEHDDRLTGVFEYRIDLFDAESIARMAQHFHILLESLVSRPDQSIGEITLMAADEREVLLTAWNQTQLDYPRTSTIKDMFERQVTETPLQTAVVFGSESISYQELNHRANQIAHALIDLGAGPEVLVGICMDRSIDMIASLLGILKSGSAYIPLDPEYPEQRIAFMIEDSHLKILVTKQAWLATLSSSPDQTLCIDRDQSRLAAMPTHNPEVDLHASNAAYVIYTSGSTGKPKGVVVEHRNTVSFLYWAHATFASKDLEGVLAATSICFDLSIFEIFLPLNFGHKVILVADILALRDLPSSTRVTMVNTVPSAVTALLKVGGMPESVRVVNTAGEVLPAAIVEQIYATGHVTHVYDLYGPTETTTYSTFALRQSNAQPTIGRPIANTRIYLLDGKLRPVVTGVPGEIYISGDGVARGYLGRPELTADRFVSLAHLGESARAYKTGDLARYRSDGNLEYAGRLDYQVKLRGHRIELGEIEAALREFPAIDDAVVLLQQSPAAGDSLAAFVTLRDSTHAFTSTAVLAYLRHRLPAYMSLGNILPLQSFPRTPNGKLDRKALAAIPWRPTAARAMRYPRNREERQIANIWEYCFDRRPIGIDEDFFEIGGHSLMAFQMFSEIEMRMGKRLMLASLFQAPTIEALAALVRQDGWVAPPSSVRQIHAGGHRPTLYCVESSAHHRAEYERLACHLGREQAVFALDAVHHGDNEHTNGSATNIQQNAAWYADELRRFQPSGPYLLISSRSAASVALSIGICLSSFGRGVSLILIDPEQAAEAPTLISDGHLSSSGGFLRPKRRGSAPINGVSKSALVTDFPGTLAVLQSRGDDKTSSSTAESHWQIQAQQSDLLRSLACRKGTMLNEHVVGHTATIIQQLLKQIAQ